MKILQPLVLALLLAGVSLTLHSQKDLYLDSLITELTKLGKAKQWQQVIDLSNRGIQYLDEGVGRANEYFADLSLKKGLANHYKGNNKEALECWIVGAETVPSHLQENSPAYGRLIRSIGTKLLEIGEFERSLPYLQKAEVQIKKRVGDTHWDYGVLMTNLGNYYFSMGQSHIAQPYFEKALKICEKIEGKENGIYPMRLTHLGNNYRALGLYDKAVQCVDESLEIFEKMYGKKDYEYPYHLRIKANIYRQNKQWDKALAAYSESVDLLLELYGETTGDYADFITDASDIYFDMKSFEEAKQYLLQAQRILSEIAEKKPHIQLKVTTRLAKNYAALEVRDSALYYFKQALEAYPLIYGKAHPAYIDFIGEYLLFAKENNTPDDYEKYYETMQRGFVHQLTGTLPILIGDHQEQFLKSRIRNFNTLIALNADLTSKKSYPVEKIFDFTLLLKGVVLENKRNIRSIVEKQEDSVLTDLFNSWNSQKNKLAQLYTSAKSDALNIDSLEATAESLEKELIQKIPDLSDKLRSVHWQDVQYTLGQDEVAIEFIHFNTYHKEWTDTVEYAALLLANGWDAPKIVPLFREDDLRRLLGSPQQELRLDYVDRLYSFDKRGIIAVKGLEKSLFSLIWEPLLPYLSGKKHIYYSNSGLLHRIAHSAIPVSKTESLGDLFNLVCLQSTRRLVQADSNNNREIRSALLFGDIDFEKDTISIKEAEELDAISIAQSKASASRASDGEGTWQSLHFTGKEVMQVHQKLAFHGIETERKTKKEATEDYLKKLSGSSKSADVLHLATHGFFFPERAAASEPSKTGNLPFMNSPNPMVRSGLVMAGANHVWSGNGAKPGEEDGILTALEISNLDLTNTELVVLSACETGLGDIQGNEGVYGLQRAFKIAGARYLLMSLWQVPDKQTSLLMTKFYEKWLDDQLSIPAAFHAAQKEMRELGFDPYQWAGFVLIE